MLKRKGRPPKTAAAAGNRHARRRQIAIGEQSAIEEQEAIAGIGHNQPPEPIAAAAAPLTYTPEEIAKKLRMGRNQVYEAMERGDFKSIRIGKRWHVLRAPFDRQFAGEAGE